MAITDDKLRTAPLSSHPYKLYDSGGLFVIVRPNGSKWWRMRYRWPGRGEQTLAFGIYPDVSLVQARERRDAARALIEKGINPADEVQEDKKIKKAEKATFGSIATEWLDMQDKMLAQKTMKKTRWMLESFVLPVLADTPMLEITAPQVLALLRTIEEKELYETAHRVKHRIGQIIRYSIALGKGGVDVTASLKGLLVPNRVAHHPAITAPEAFGKLLRDIWGYQSNKPAATALKLAPLLFVRPGELQQMEWTEINFKQKLWTIPAHKMKTVDGQKAAHYVPLSPQVIELLRELQHKTGGFQYVFPNYRSCVYPMSNAALRVALDRLGYPGTVHTVHGFRASARTMLDEVLGYRIEWIEAQLAHMVKDANGRAYNRTVYMPQRTEMMSAWADYLDKLRSGVIPGAAEYSV